MGLVPRNIRLRLGVLGSRLGIGYCTFAEIPRAPSPEQARAIEIVLSRRGNGAIKALRAIYGNDLKVQAVVVKLLAGLTNAQAESIISESIPRILGIIGRDAAPDQLDVIVDGACREGANRSYVLGAFSAIIDRIGPDYSPRMLCECIDVLSAHSIRRGTLIPEAVTFEVAQFTQLVGLVQRSLSPIGLRAVCEIIDRVPVPSVGLWERDPIDGLSPVSWKPPACIRGLGSGITEVEMVECAAILAAVPPKVIEDFDDALGRVLSARMPGSDSLVFGATGGSPTAFSAGQGVSRFCDRIVLLKEVRRLVQCAKELPPKQLAALGLNQIRSDHRVIARLIYALGGALALAGSSSTLPLTQEVLEWFAKRGTPGTDGERRAKELSELARAAVSLGCPADVFIARLIAWQGRTTETAISVQGKELALEGAQSDTETIRLVGARNLREHLSKESQSMRGTIDAAFEDSRFQPIRLISSSKSESLGVVYAVCERIAGARAIILAGIIIESTAIKIMGSKKALVYSLVKALEQVAVDSALTGGVWLSVGGIGQRGGVWEDTSCGGFSELAETFARMSGVSSGLPRIINFVGDEQIEFPARTSKKFASLMRVSCEAKDSVGAAPQPPVSDESLSSAVHGAFGPEISAQVRLEDLGELRSRLLKIDKLEEYLRDAAPLFQQLIPRVEGGSRSAKFIALLSVVVELPQLSGESVGAELCGVLNRFGTRISVDHLNGLACLLGRINRAHILNGVTTSRAFDVIQDILPTILDRSVFHSSLPAVGDLLSKMLGNPSVSPKYLAIALRECFFAVERGEPLQLAHLAVVADSVSKFGSDVAVGLALIIRQLKSIPTTAELQVIGERLGQTLKLGPLYSLWELLGPEALRPLSGNGQLSVPQVKRVLRVLEHSGQAGLKSSLAALSLLVPRWFPRGQAFRTRYFRLLSRIAVLAGSNAPKALSGVFPAMLALSGRSRRDSTIQSVEKFYQSGPQSSDAIGSHIHRLAALADLVFAEGQKFEEPKREFVKRVRKWIDRELAPVIVVKNKSFQAELVGEVGDYRVINGKALSADLYYGVFRDFMTDASRHDALSSLWQISGIGGPDEAILCGSEAECAAILTALRTLSGRRLGLGVKAIRGLLPSLSGVRLSVPEEGSPAARTHALFSTICESFTGPIPEWLAKNGVVLDAESKVEVDKFLHSLRGELAKITDTGAVREIEVNLFGTKGLFDSAYDAIGENCAGKYRSMFRHKKFQPIRLVEASKYERHVGIVYALRTSINGLPSLLLAGVHVRKSYAYSLRSSGVFIENLIDTLVTVAADNRLIGGGWTVVGAASAENGALWQADGRIAQYDLIRHGLVNLGLTRNGQAGFQCLLGDERIKFPPGGAKLERVLRLSRVNPYKSS